MQSIYRVPDLRDSLIHRSERLADKLSDLELQGAQSTPYYQQLDHTWNELESQLTILDYELSLFHWLGYL